MGRVSGIGEVQAQEEDIKRPDFELAIHWVSGTVGNLCQKSGNHRNSATPQEAPSDFAGFLKLESLNR